MNASSIIDSLLADLSPLRFRAPVACTYSPLDYARAAFEEYLRRYARGPCEAILLGMNPGPWGMVQTGIPFGEVSAVRDWLGIRAKIGRPRSELALRPVRGLDCPRSEVSGKRLWGWAKDLFGTPERFCSRFVVLNYCPLCFFDAAARNLTPDKISVGDRRSLFAACDRALLAFVDHLRPRYVVGIGRFAEARAREALQESGVFIGHMPHPSPASPQSNRDWASQATASLSAMGIRLPQRRIASAERSKRISVRAPVRRATSGASP